MVVWRRSGSAVCAKPGDNSSDVFSFADDVCNVSHQVFVLGCHGVGLLVCADNLFGRPEVGVWPGENKVRLIRRAG